MSMWRTTPGGMLGSFSIDVGDREYGLLIGRVPAPILLGAGTRSSSVACRP
jgi:hypothetical protein